MLGQGQGEGEGKDQDPAALRFELSEKPPSGLGAVRALTLEEALVMGVTQNPAMRIATERVEQARAVYEQQKSVKSPRLLLNNTTAIQPRRTIDTSDLLLERFPNFPDKFVLVDPVTDQFSLSLQKLLTTFGRVESAISAAFLKIDVETANAEVQKQKLMFEVKSAFFQKLKADAAVAANRSTLGVSQENLSDTKALLKQGVLARYDLLQAQIEVTRAAESLSANLTQVDKSQATLAKLLGEKQTRMEPIPPPAVVVDEAVTLPLLQSFARLHRAEILALDYKKAVAESLLDAAEKDSRPELLLAANYQTAFGQSLAPKNIPSLTLQIQWALFDGGLRKAKIAEAESVLRELDASRELLADDINLEVEQLWLDLQQSKVSVATAQQQLANAKEYYEMARRRYLNGISPSIEVSDALRNLIDSETRLVEQLYDRDLIFSRLEQSLGSNVPERRLSTEFLNVEARRPNDENE